MVRRQAYRQENAGEALYSTQRETGRDGFTRTVIEAMEWQGWRVYHTTDSRLDTIYGETGRGFPDIMAVRPRDGRILVAELKSETGTLSTEQLIWLGVYMQRSGVEVYTWKPHDIDEIHRIIA